MGQMSTTERSAQEANDPLLSPDLGKTHPGVLLVADVTEKA
jgi:hypothetical protein